MKITLNGQVTDCKSPTVALLLAELGLEGKPVVVEHNQQALLKSEHAATPIAENDLLEIVTLAAGG